MSSLSSHSRGASLQRDPKSPYWYCCYRSVDGKQHHRSTKTKNKKEAAIICHKWLAAAKLSRKKKLTIESARRLTEEAMKELLELAGETLPNSSIGEFFKSWLKQKQDVGAISTQERYEGIVKKFLAFLGDRHRDSLPSLTKADILTFRDELADSVSAGTVNTYLKVLRVALGRAVKEQMIEKNPAALVDRLSNRDRHRRRAFTMAELQALLRETKCRCQDEQKCQCYPGQWQTLIVLGLYTGQRLGDLASLTWRNLDLEACEMALIASKTNKANSLPLHPAVMRRIASMRAGDDPESPLLPDLACRSSSWLSNKFYDLMADAKIVRARDHQGAEDKLKVAKENYKHQPTAEKRAEVEYLERKSKGRDKRRALNVISFHALRHTATSLLKNAGVSDVVARDIIGHESAAVSAEYTHLETAIKREAILKMPNVYATQHQIDLQLERRSP